MFKKVFIYLFLLLIFGATLMAYPVVKQSGPEINERIKSSQQFTGEHFTNPKTIDLNANLGATMKRVLFEKPAFATPNVEIPVSPIDPASFAEHKFALYRLGHSSILLKLGQEFWLIDPVFSERASPYQFMGPKRFHQTPISLEDLPEITGVIISHDHYDHLDKTAIQSLKDKVTHFVTPLGVGQQIQKWGVAEEKIHQLDWWQSISIGDSKLVATPAQHFSGRGLLDRNKTLWASWVIQHQDLKIFYSGDTGYFDGFKKIGERFGPFDITLMETGAYDKNWPEIHMTPEESVQAHIDLQGKNMLPVHNSTFDLAVHNWFEPFERAEAAAKTNDVNLVTPIVGEALPLDQSLNTSAWWKALMP